MAVHIAVVVIGDPAVEVNVPAWADKVGSPAADEVVCHGDFGPWNLVWHGTTPVGILDRDYAWPQPARHDVAYAIEYVAPFRSDEDCARWLRYPAPPDRRARMEIFAEAYGITRFDGLYDAVLGEQEEVAARARHLADAGHQPQAFWAPEVFAALPT
jgi:aminoglycoside phosphotransferase (APT) family kinase protein